MINKEKIKKEIDKWDPMGLISMEYTKKNDEYDLEVDDIHQRLQKYEVINEAVIAGVIYVVFARAFGQTFTKDFGKDDCFAVAREILREA